MLLWLTQPHNIAMDSSAAFGVPGLGMREGAMTRHSPPFLVKYR